MSTINRLGSSIAQSSDENERKYNLDELSSDEYPSDATEYDLSEREEEPLLSTHKKYSSLHKRITEGYYTEKKSKQMLSLISSLSSLEKEKTYEKVIASAWKQLEELSSLVGNLYLEDLLFHLSQSYSKRTNLTERITDLFRKRKYPELGQIRKVLQGEEGKSEWKKSKEVVPKEAKNSSQTRGFILEGDIEGSLDIATEQGDSHTMEKALRLGDTSTFSRASVNGALRKAAKENFFVVLSYICIHFHEKIDEESAGFALYFSAHLGNDENCQILLTHLKERLTCTFLVRAAKKAAGKNRPQMVKAILELALTKNRKEVGVKTQLDQLFVFLGEYGDTENAKLALSFTEETLQGGSALMKAALYNHPDFIQLLLQEKKVLLDQIAIKHSLALICTYGYKKAFSHFSSLFSTKGNRLTLNPHLRKIGVIEEEYAEYLKAVARANQNSDLLELEKKTIMIAQSATE